MNVGEPIYIMYKMYNAPATIVNKAEQWLMGLHSACNGICDFLRNSCTGRNNKMEIRFHKEKTLIMSHEHTFSHPLNNA